MGKKNAFSLEETEKKVVEQSDNAGVELRKYEGVDGSHAAAAGADVDTRKVSFMELFRFADRTDKILMTIGTIMAICHGTMVQINFIVLANVLDTFLYAMEDLDDGTNGTNTTSDEQEDIQDLLDAIPWIVTQFCCVAIGILIFGYFQLLTWVITADRQATVVRRTAFHNILRQHMGYFDKHPGGELNTRMTEDMATYSAGIGDKVATWIQWIFTFIMGGVICLIRGWQLTLVLLLVAPIAAVVGIVVAKMQRGVAFEEMLAYSKAGGAAEECLAAIRIVAAYSGEEKEAQRYETLLKPAETLGIKKGMIGGIGQGIVWVIAFFIVGLAFAFGGYLYREHDYSAGFILQVIFAMFVGMRALGWSVGSMEAISAARGAACGIYDIIDAESKIDSASKDGLRPTQCNSAISFEGVHFVYPTRPDVPILRGLDIEVKPGQTVALVGPSGCGKSTTIQLLQRYYECEQGTVTIDGNDVTKLNIQWLRSQIGVVSQEPVLFATDISTNIRFGREDCTQEEIMAASKEANAHDFIMKLPNGYDTVISETGTQLSRGQKQRIALARALVRNPKILLLDEATSALDNESEAIVQDALDEAAKTRTTIIIAHRLSTVRHADILFIIDKGVVAEQGNHDQLMEMQGLYWRLVSKQLAGAKTGQGEDAPEPTFDDVVGDGSKKPKASRALSVVSSGQRSIVEDTIKKQEEMMEQEIPPPALKRVFQLNSPETCQLVCGTISAMFQGFIFPSLAVLFGEILGAFAIEDVEEQKDEINFYVVIICIVGVFAGFFTWGMVYFFGYSGEKLTFRLRVMAFRTMLSQEIAWFDDKNNQVGTLTSRLANDASRVKGATGTQLMTLVNATSCAGLSVIIGFIFGWQLAVVVCCFLPFLIMVGILQTQMMSGFAKGSQKAVEESGKIVSEAIDKVLTVAALTKEPYFEEKFQNHFDALKKGVRKKAHLFGITWGVSSSLIYLSYAAAFGFGTYLVATWVMEFKDVFRVFIAICAGGVELGRVNAITPDISKAKVAAAKLFQLFDRESKINPNDESGIKPAGCDGEVRFKKIRFSFPTRPEVEVLRGFSLGVNRGQFVAMVGPSGSGKSTVLQLLERFYDVLIGSVSLDGVAIKDLNIEWLRRKIAIVTQEPVLFSNTIKDNIAYGDTSRQVPMEEIIQAAKSANIHNFIVSLPMGYDTHLGTKGTQLSGGQRQRVSIARALVRNPKILLLDDATSALDSESEKVVEDALAKAQEGRTSIVVAHRLSTVVSADLICYVDRGEIVEKGTHEELMSQRGYYFKLQQMYLGNRDG